MFQNIAKLLATAFTSRRPELSRFPTYLQTSQGGFGKSNGGSYVLEMKTFPFKEEDIHIKVTESEILIQGKMEEKTGDDFMMYVFTKKCRPPTDVDVSSIEYKFVKDTLILTARTNK